VIDSAPLLRPISCPSCGGAAGRIAPGDIRECPYCAVPLTLVAGATAGSSAILPSFDEERVRHVVEAFLVAQGTPANLRESAVRRSIELLFVPFFDILLVEGAEASAPVRCRLGVARFTAIALEESARDLGADRIDPDRVRKTAGNPFDAVDLATRGAVLEPQRTPESIHLPSIMSEPVVLERRVRVVYYPVWLARYSYGKSLYQVGVDGMNGDVLRGVAPASMNRRVLAGVGFTLLFSVMAAVLVGNPRIIFQLIQHAGDGSAIVIGGALLILAAAWDRLRFRRELLVEGLSRRQIPINRPKETTLDALAQTVLEFGRSRGRAFRPRGWD